MRFLAQLLMTALFGVLITFTLTLLTPPLTGWQGALVFWVEFLVGFSVGTQLAYWVAGYIPEPPRPPRDELEDEPPNEEVEHAEDKVISD